MSLYAKMLIERAARAAFAAFASSIAIAASNPNVSIPTIKAAVIAAAAAAVSAAITVVSNVVGAPRSGSFLPAAPDVNATP